MPFFIITAMYPVHRFQAIDSTNIKAKELADGGAVSGTGVIAGYQTKGRGRLGKQWHSVAGKGLFCSIIVRPDVPLEDYPKITLVAGLSVALVLDRLVTAATFLKWPNDIHIAGKKIAGILTESSPLTGNRGAGYAVIGVGINVNQDLEDFPLDLRGNVTSLFLETGRECGVDELFFDVRREILKQLQVFCADGFLPILAQWRKKDFLLGKEMECVNRQGKKIRGIAQGPDDDGQLHVLDGSGRMHEVLSGDVRLATR